MTDGAQRIANFVGDAAGQAAECCELQLLSLLLDLGGIFEEYDDVTVGPAGRDGAEVCSNFGRVWPRLEGTAAQRVVVAPLGQARDQCLGQGVDGLTVANETQQGARRLIQHPYLVIAVHHQDAGAHPLNDRTIDELQTGDLGSAGHREQLAAAQP